MDVTDLIAEEHHRKILCGGCWWWWEKPVGHFRLDELGTVIVFEISTSSNQCGRMSRMRDVANPRKKKKKKNFSKMILLQRRLDLDRPI